MVCRGENICKGIVSAKFKEKLWNTNKGENYKTRNRMKYYLTILLALETFICFGQTNTNFDYIANKWVEGKVNEKGIVVKAEIRRGGLYHLNINQDATTEFGAPDNCGYGSGTRYGTWELNQQDASITFYFSKLYRILTNPHEKVDINQTETYKIIKLTQDELILTSIVEGKLWTIAFVKRLEK